jgi:uncharacterized protein YndB with AHSA1/START domain
MRFTKETIVKATPEQVFGYVSDLTKHAEWANEDLSVQKTSSGPLGVGSTFESVAHKFGTQKEKQTITEYMPASRVVYESNGALGTVRHSFDLSALDGGTRVAKTSDLARPTFLARLTTLMIGREQPRALQSDLRKIKQHFES